MTKPYLPPQPKHIGVKVFEDVSLEVLRTCIDWTPFFLSWELRGKFPAIMENEVYGEEARKLYDDAQVLLDKIIREKRLCAKAVCGIFPANSTSTDDIEIYTDETRTEVRATLNMLRQQSKKVEGIPNLCLSDFIAPKNKNIPDYIGAFVVTAGHGCEELCAEYEAAHDDYSSIMVKALADRLAEAAAEYFHWYVRTEMWGYSPNEALKSEEFIQENYTGIRPAPGYPACPDHTEKQKLFELLSASAQTGVHLTESFAMYPAASVSGWYFSHPVAKYFTIGHLSRDQVANYAARKQWDVATAEKWLASLLAYVP